MAPALRFDRVTKTFIHHTGRVLLRDRLIEMMRPSRRPRFEALKDVSFELAHGDSLGLVGPNGAGKSTILNLATGLSLPDHGSITVNGRVTALLELGAGFHPDLTGAENIRVNAISAGPIRTLAGAGIADARFMFNFQRAHSPLRRTVTIENVGGAALYLLSPLSDGVTGEVHFVDAGYNIVSMPRPDEIKS